MADNRTSTPLAIVGELVEIPQDGYLYGLGVLILRVTEVTPAPDYGWVNVMGHEVGWDGHRVGTRAVVAKASAIKLIRHPA